MVRLLTLNSGVKKVKRSIFSLQLPQVPSFCYFKIPGSSARFPRKKWKGAPSPVSVWRGGKGGSLWWSTAITHPKEIRMLESSFLVTTLGLSPTLCLVTLRKRRRSPYPTLYYHCRVYGNKNDVFLMTVLGWSLASSNYHTQHIVSSGVWLNYRKQMSVNEALNNDLTIIITVSATVFGSGSDKCDILSMIW